MLTEKDFIATTYNSIESASFEWSAPSNIALVKYWGKKENQIPANPSISFTLNNCKTITKVHFQKKEAKDKFSFASFINENVYIEQRLKPSTQ